jgi:hypothetical protein
MFPAIVIDVGRWPPHDPLHVPSHALFGAACRELAKRSDTGIDANTIRRLIFMNLSLD